MKPNPCGGPDTPAPTHSCGAGARRLRIRPLRTTTAVQALLAPMNGPAYTREQAEHAARAHDACRPKGMRKRHREKATARAQSRVYAGPYNGKMQRQNGNGGEGDSEERDG